ncbi:dTDP-4-dehydrorhamnose reductase [Breznakia sp. PF5-3]|uniref:dTDP-4-dehydrorhamnose reductase n=1 Tax=unclassified Breznakia TaxID=2623764 RepID=UPI00240680E6|nr:MULTISPECIES: dTDP-4-dehydrorhamnose reductase [unclassified Breznakia]MDF9824996.1 dTDP-4-dehydrorhamnose reductase [Breznakia sp. PM6-1]MDF9835811.1 dTDP-4-dehydrorhamnose reductase [Breznakia sp. PF5-3]MDF9836937.1 dTDP-4-dehydrorhamnose reductase [Breznakia sp. PFB2-8]MDF9859883.1 dTDP-4-dehydrorhamnose reductase [Breznakia sp. PH5-24]
MKLLVTGYKGQLGYDIVNEAQKRGINAVGVDIEEMDITNSKQVQQVITQGNYDAVIHCAAYTAVDQAEDNSELCYKINVEGTKNVLDVCEKLNIPIMYFSTDYVFNGQGEAYWKEYDKREPLNIYGDSKYRSELDVEKYKKHFIIRISWVFGVNGNNFVKKMLQLGSTYPEIKVVDDQIGSPTYTYDLAILAVDMIQSEAYGTYHASNEGICSWYDFACEIFRQANIDVKVIPVNSDEFPVKAKRPNNSRMNKGELDKHNFKRLPDWKDALKRYLEIIKC